VAAQQAVDAAADHRLVLNDQYLFHVASKISLVARLVFCHCEPSEAISAVLALWRDCFVAVAPRNDISVTTC
jgi:hypothetical protein